MKLKDLNQETFDNNKSPDDRNFSRALQLQEVVGVARMVEIMGKGGRRAGPSPMYQIAQLKKRSTAVHGVR